MNQQQNGPRVVGMGDATVYDQMQGEKIHIVLSAEDTGGTMSLFVDVTPPGGGPPLHIHHNEDETFFVLEGELTVQVAGERCVMRAGDTAFLPRGVPHGFVNLGDQTVRSLVMTTPGGLERFFADVEPLAMRDEPDMPAILSVAARHGVEVVGPPLTVTENQPQEA